MKQLQLTPEIESRIKKVVGDDVETTGFAVFESISLNTLPLTGKDGTIFEKAVVSELTLRQMADSINSGNTLPLIWSHNGDDVPKGRVFYAELHTGDLGESEFRTLWYVDPTEQILKDKLNAASIDEVSVSFLASQILCSECGFDYRGPDATIINLMDRICAEGHEIGQDGVHTRLIGLAVFTELSLVSRGAAKEAKIVGKSKSKLAAPLQQLAAKGMEIDKLYLSASRGELNVDIDALVTNLSDVKAELKVTSKEVEALKLSSTTLTEENTSLKTKVGELETELTAAKDASKETELAAATTELTEAKTILGALFVKLAVASGETDPKAPDTIAELNAGIEKYQSKLTALLPIGGVSSDTKKGETGSKFRADHVSAFSVNGK
jgi:regulator of replication initiation timing